MTDEPRPDELADDEDELDGCDVDMAAEPVEDEALLGVVLGDSPEKHDEYRMLFPPCYCGCPRLDHSGGEGSCRVCDTCAAYRPEGT